MKLRIFNLIAPLLASLTCLCLTAGCEKGDDHFDHTPPAGQGSIILENFTYTDIEFFIDGIQQGTIKSDRNHAFDLAPGVYRVVLNDKGGDRNWADDVDVLEGRLTILTVKIDTSSFDAYLVTRVIQ